MSLILDVFIPGKLRNPLNGSWGGWQKHAQLAKQWRHRTALEILGDWILAGRPPRAQASTPKLVTFTAHVGRLWDTDNLPGGIKPVRDGLVDAKIIDSDAPGSGHRFVYEQRVDHANRGVQITVEPLFFARVKDPLPPADSPPTGGTQAVVDDGG
jgi:hypothetical protein